MIIFNTLVEQNQVAKPQPSANLGKQAHNAEIQRTVGTTILKYILILPNPVQTQHELKSQAGPMPPNRDENNFKKVQSS
jgi:hypothetical protein